MAVEEKGLQIVNNMAQWVIAPGEIARRISPADFENLDNITGISVQKGVSAVIEIDGREIAQISGGDYQFIDNKKVDELLSRRVIDSSSLRGVAVSVWRSLIKFVCGRKIGETGSFDSQNRTVGEAIRHINGNADINVYLKVDRAFPSIYGYDKENPQEPFTEMTISAKNGDVQVAVSMLLQISDFHAFVRQYLCDRESVTTMDIQEILALPIKNLLQQELQSEEIDEFGISSNASERIAMRLKNLESYLIGITVKQVVDITCQDEDFKRFRDLSKQLYCSERELDFLRRSNEFRNRLASVNNEQEIREAKTRLEQIKILDEVNRDGLLHKDEMDRFLQTLDIRREEAQLEREGAGLRIQTERVQKTAEYAKIKMDIETDLLRHQIRSESSIEEEQFKARSRKSVYETEERKAQIQAEIALNDLLRSHEEDTAIRSARTQNILIEEKLKGQFLADDYAEKARLREIDLNKYQEDIRFAQLKEKQDLALSALERMNADKERSADRAHLRDLEKEQLAQRGRLAEIEAAGRKTPEQLIAEQIRELGGETAVAFVTSLGARQAAEAAADKREAEMAREQAEHTAAMYERMIRMQQEAGDKMINLSQQSMRTHTDILMESHAKDREKAQDTLDRMERISTQRIEEVKEQKEEYRQQMQHEQARIDQTQEKALNYTTQLSESGLRSNIPRKEEFYYIESFGPVPFSPEQVRTLIANGVIHAMTPITSRGEQRNAADFPEFRNLFGEH